MEGSKCVGSLEEEKRKGQEQAECPQRPQSSGHKQGEKPSCAKSQELRLVILIPCLQLGLSASAPPGRSWKWGDWTRKGTLSQCSSFVHSLDVYCAPGRGRRGERGRTWQVELGWCGVMPPATISAEARGGERTVSERAGCGE